MHDQNAALSKVWELRKEVSGHIILNSLMDPMLNDVLFFVLQDGNRSQLDEIPFKGKVSILSPYHSLKGVVELCQYSEAHAWHLGGYVIEEIHLRSGVVMRDKLDVARYFFPNYQTLYELDVIDQINTLSKEVLEGILS